MSSVLLWLAVSVLSGLGAVARVLVAGAVSARFGGRFPLGTLVVNLSGALLAGLLVGISLSGDGYLLTATAVLGSYTTFSTWMLESYRLARERERWLLVANAVGSLALGLAAVALGRLIAG
jgi:CrcB protein